MYKNSRTYIDLNYSHNLLDFILHLSQCLFFLFSLKWFVPSLIIQTFDTNQINNRVILLVCQLDLNACALFIVHVKYHIYVACLKQIMQLIHKDWMWEGTYVTPFRTGLVTSSVNSSNFNFELSQNVYHHLSSFFILFPTGIPAATI